MSAVATLHLVLDLIGTFAFGLNGALTAVRTARVDIVGVVTLGMITALGGGIIRDMLLDDLPPATFRDWRYLVTAAAGALIAFALGRHLHRLAGLITVLDTVGLSVFAVSGANKVLEFDIGVGRAVILGTITAVGGGTLRDVLIGQIPHRAAHRVLRRSRPRGGHRDGRRQRLRRPRTGSGDRRGRGLLPYPDVGAPLSHRCAASARNVRAVGAFGAEVTFRCSPFARRANRGHTLAAGGFRATRCDERCAAIQTLSGGNTP